MDGNTVKVPHLIVQRAVADGRSECVWLWLFGKKVDADNHGGHSAGWVEIAELKKAVMSVIKKDDLSDEMIGLASIIVPIGIRRIISDGDGLFWTVSRHDSPRLFLFGYARVANECGYGFYSHIDRINIPVTALFNGHKALADAVGK